MQLSSGHDGCHSFCDNLEDGQAENQQILAAVQLHASMQKPLAISLSAQGKNLFWKSGVWRVIVQICSDQASDQFHHLSGPQNISWPRTDDADGLATSMCISCRGLLGITWTGAFNLHWNTGCALQDCMESCTLGCHKL